MAGQTCCDIDRRDRGYDYDLEPVAVMTVCKPVENERKTVKKDDGCPCGEKICICTSPAGQCHSDSEDGMKRNPWRMDTWIKI